MSRTAAQIARQADRYRENGKYAKVNPCRICGKSSGVDYLSHHDTDNTIDDELICLCQSCAIATQDMTGPEAVAWMNEQHKTNGGPF